jgi:hypothetical protein
VPGEDRKRDCAAIVRSPIALQRRSRFLGNSSPGWKSARTLFVLGLVALFVISFSSALPPTGRTASPGGPSGLKVAVTPPTPPPEFNCIGFGAALAVISPSHVITVPAAGPVGTVFELEGSGYYNRTSGPLGSFTIWMANYSGGSLLYLTLIPAGVPVHFFVNVTVPSKNGTTPFPAGPYEFWSLENYTRTPTCANAPFDLTAAPPPSLGCLSWSAQLLVTSPVPASGTAGAPVGLQGRAFSPTGDTTIYWANATGSPYANVGTTPTSDPQGWFNTTIDVPSGYTAGLYAFWAIDGDSDCAGAIFNVTGVPTYTVTFVEQGLPASTSWSVTLAGSPMSSTTTSIQFTGANGLYAFTVGTVPGYSASPSSGSVTVSGGPVTKQINFTSLSSVPPPSSSPTGFLGLSGSDGYVLLGVIILAFVVLLIALLLRRHRYPVIFSETGLPKGTVWSVTLDLDTRSSRESEIVFKAPDGIHSFRVGPVKGYRGTPSSGSVEVKGDRRVVAVAFALAGATT